MKPIIKIVLLILCMIQLVSCSRFHYLPRATVKKEIKNTTIETRLIDSKLVRIESMTEPEDIKVPIRKQQPRESNKKIVMNHTEVHTQIDFGKAPNDSTIINITNPKEKYRRLGRYIFGSSIITVIGVILVVSEILEAGLFIISIGAFLLSVFVTGLVLSYIFDKLHVEVTPSSGKKNEGKDSPQKEKNAENGKTRKPFNSVNYIFIYFLICNLIILLLDKIKFKDK